MDRASIAPWKAEEKEQSEKLYKKLRGLALLYPMNDELSKLFSWDFFLKSNQPAFFQVMHYLFRILDPAEFKRRFFWPITDKKSEAIFRSSTVDYLKHLNEKHHLQWTNIKSYLVVMPGGMKFINFLLDLVGFVVQELIRQREYKGDLSVPTMLEQNAFLKEYSSGYIEELEKCTTLCLEGTERVMQIYAQIAINTGIDESLLLDEQFLEDCEAYNRRKHEQQTKLPAANNAKLVAPLCALNKAMDQLESKRAAHKHNNEAVDNTLCGIQKLLGSDNLYATGYGTKVNYVLSAFCGISEPIAEQLNANDHYNESNEFVTTDLRAVSSDLQQIEQQLVQLQKHLNARGKEHSSNINNSGNANSNCTLQQTVPRTPLRTLDPRTQLAADGHPLLLKYVSTPPIKPEMDANGVRCGVHVRLPLQDDFNAKQFETTCNNLLAPPRTARKAKSQSQSQLDLSSTLNRSKIVDAMQMLRTINKTAGAKTNTRLNLSSLGSKWKQMQASFGFDDATPTMPISPISNTGSSPHTPFNNNECTLIERLPPAQVAAAADTSNSSLYAKKSVAMMKVLDASLNVKNLSTSPSGRLEPLVPISLPEQQGIPRVLLNDQTLCDTQLLPCSSKENDANQLNKSTNELYLDLVEYDDGDDLMNVSDTVLKDIIM